MPAHQPGRMTARHSRARAGAARQGRVLVAVRGSGSGCSGRPVVRRGGQGWPPRGASDAEAAHPGRRRPRPARSCADSRPITAPACAASRTGDIRSRRARSEACTVEGTASGGSGPSSTRWLACSRRWWPRFHRETPAWPGQSAAPPGALARRRTAVFSLALPSPSKNPQKPSASLWRSNTNSTPCSDHLCLQLSTCSFSQSRRSSRITRQST